MVLTLNEPYYPAMQDFALVRPVRFLRSGGVDGAGEFDEPIGTGPWKVESLSDTRAVLVRNEVEGFQLGGSEYDWAFAVQDVAVTGD